MNPKDVIGEIVRQCKDIGNVNVHFVVNTSHNTLMKDYENSKHSILTEFLTEEEYNDIISAIKKWGFDLTVFYNEDDYIKYIYKNGEHIDLDRTVVFNLARNGKGIDKKAVIPAFCNLHDISVTGSGAYHVCLGRHKYHTNCILSNIGCHTAKSWLYTKNGWLNGDSPDNGKVVIAKPVWESASRGISDQSVLPMNQEAVVWFDDMLNQFQQNVIVQEFISGYEVQVPLIIDKGEVMALTTAGVMMQDSHVLGNKIVTYDIAYNEQYSFYQFGNVDVSLAKRIKIDAVKAIQCLGIEQYGRIDYRVSMDGQYYITDISTHPFLIRHSAFAFAFEELGMSFVDIFAFLIYQRVLENKQSKI